MTALAEKAPAAPPAPAEPGGPPRWTRPALLVLLAATAVLYLWDLGASGWANAYYSAAAQAGSASWKALFFGSTDAANAITVDKTPASLWVMGLSARIFGVSAWSILVPQALMGVGSVWLLHSAVRRWSGPVAGLVAGAALAATPVAALIFRFNNPDALLVLLLVAGAYCVVRATEKASPKWLMLAGAAVGFGFLAKMLQAFLVLPAFALVYLVAADTPLRRRILHLLAAAGAMVVSGGWWVAVVELWPAGSRPFIGGSQSNSILELTLGYNGFGRLTGDEVGSVGGGAGWGEAGWSRLFGSEMGSDVAWLLPGAILVLLGGFWVTRRAPRTDRTRAGLLLWGGWLVVTGAVFSAMNGIIHPYYAVALAPAAAAVVGIGAAALWQRRDDPVAAGVLSGAVALTAIESYLLLGRESDWLPWLRVAVLVVGLLCAALIMLPIPGRRAVAVLALVAALAGPAAYSVATAATPHTGSIPSVGPANASGLGGPGGGRGGGGMGGLLSATTPTDELTALLTADSASYTWIAAAVGSNNAAGYQLATGSPVLALGGFNGTDPAPTLAEFQQLVASGEVHYFLGGTLIMGGRGGTGTSTTSGSDDANSIARWVAANYPSRQVGGVTVHDLSDAPAAS